MIRWLTPDWPPIPGVKAASTLRSGGASTHPFAELNLGDHVGDDPQTVERNRQQLILALGLRDAPAWLQQVHGTQVVEARPGHAVTADASHTGQLNTPCVVLTADCLPVLFARTDGQKVAAAHAGWRGLAAGILDATLDALGSRSVQVWLGPAIGPRAFEVGQEVFDAFNRRTDAAAECFSKTTKDRYHADLYQLARTLLRLSGVDPASIYGGDRCTFLEPDCFYSYRRDRTTGRMATLIWREKDPPA